MVLKARGICFVSKQPGNWCQNVFDCLGGGAEVQLTHHVDDDDDTQTPAPLHQARVSYFNELCVKQSDRYLKRMIVKLFVSLSTFFKSQTELTR